MEKLLKNEEEVFIPDNRQNQDGYTREFVYICISVWNLLMLQGIKNKEHICDSPCAAVHGPTWTPYRFALCRHGLFPSLTFVLVDNLTWILSILYTNKIEMIQTELKNFSYTKLLKGMFSVLIWSITWTSSSLRSENFYTTLGLCVSFCHWF